MLDSYADTVPGGADYDLALWHGLGLPLLLSVLVLAVGTAAFFGRSRLRRMRTVREPLGNADQIYDASSTDSTYSRSGSPRPPSAVRFPRRSR